MEDYVLQLRGIKKSFDGVEVLHAVDLDIERGKVTALVGENGAGKSTLMKILMGEYIADAGTMALDGDAVCFKTPNQALHHGISMMFQELSPFPNMTVAQNLYIGREPQRFHFVKTRQMNRDARALLDSLNIHLAPTRLVRALTVSEMQMLEIAKAVSHNSKVVIMDEPTSAITDSEVRVLFDTIETLKSKGVTILYISHKLDELFEIADHVCVLRDGAVISARPIAEVDRQQMISEMVGRAVNQIYPSVEKEIGDVILHAKNLSCRGIFRDISFALRRGEILGIAGMVGAGRTELVEALFGITPVSSGEVVIDGREVAIKQPEDAISAGMALIPEDRARCGLNLKGTVLSNLCMTTLSKLGRWGLASRKRERAAAKTMIEKMRVKLNSESQPVNSLSGGNQQKVVVGKWLLTEPDIVLMDEPTRGIDVGAKYEIYQLIQNFAKEGKGVIMISSEMPELIGMCDRILILKEHRLVGEIDGAEASQEKIMSIIINA